MKVVAYDPFLSPERAVDLGVERVALDELLARADFITLHTPLTDATRNLIDAARHRQDEARRAPHQLRPRRARRRGGPRRRARLRPGRRRRDRCLCRGAGAATNPLFGRDNVVATPHLGAATSEAQENVALQIAEQMADFLLTGAVSNAVNMPSLTAEEAARLRPYMKLAEQLGSFAGQLTETGITRGRRSNTRARSPSSTSSR